MKQHGSNPVRRYRQRCETRTAGKSGYSREVTTEFVSAFPGDPPFFGGGAASPNISDEDLVIDPRVLHRPVWLGLDPSLGEDGPLYKHIDVPGPEAEPVPFALVVEWTVWPIRKMSTNHAGYLRLMGARADFEKKPYILE